MSRRMRHHPHHHVAAGEEYPRMRVGAKVVARFGGKRAWLAGKVVRRRRDGTYDIAYSRGELEKRVRPALILKLGNSFKSGSGRESSTDDEDNPAARAMRRKACLQRPEPLRQGMQVDAKPYGRPDWFPGRVAVLHKDGTADILFDDGDVQRHIPRPVPQRVRSLL